MERQKNFISTKALFYKLFWNILKLNLKFSGSAVQKKQLLIYKYFIIVKMCGTQTAGAV